MKAIYLENVRARTLPELLLGLEYSLDRGITFIQNSQEEKFVSYSSLLERVLRSLAFLQERGLRPGDELVLQEEDNERFLLAFWACLLGGIIPVPLAIGGKKAHMQKLFQVWRKLHHPFLFTTKAYLNKIVSYLEEFPEIDSLQFEDRYILSSELETSNKYPELAKPRPQDLAYLQFSSGSTGMPKGVMLSHDNLLYNTLDIVERLHLASDQKTLSWIPLTHDFGMIGFHLTSITAGCGQYIIPTAQFIRRPLSWLEKANEHQVNVLYSPNFGYEYFLRAFDGKSNSRWDLRSVKVIINGAEPISSELCRQFTSSMAPFGLSPNVIAPAYGLAEASVGVTLCQLDQPLKESQLDRKALHTNSKLEVGPETPSTDRVSFVHVGSPLRHCEVRICNEQDQPLPTGQIGHIQVQGRNVTSGYYNDLPATQKLFTHEGWLRTGDLGFLTAEGALVFTGRQKNMIIIQGQNYYAQDIEYQLLGLEDISLGTVVACGIPGLNGEKEKLVIFVLYKKPLPGFLPLMEAVNARLAEVLGIIPDYVIPVREILKTTSGKVQHFAFVAKFQAGLYEEQINQLRNLYARQLSDIWAQLPRSEQAREIEDWLRSLVAGILFIQTAQLDLDQPLNDQGLQSIHAVQLRNSIQQKLNLFVPIGLMYKYPTIKKLGAFIQSTLFPKLGATATYGDESPGKKNIETLLERIASLSDEEIINQLEA